MSDIEKVDALIAELGGLRAACGSLGWQGGTVHQVRWELNKRLGLGLRVPVPRA